jgi:hypothetical protein
MCNAVDKHGWRGARVSASIKNHASLNLDNFAALVRVVTHPDGCGMTMDVPEEAFLAAVLHLDWPACTQGEEATVNLKADVFARTKGAANTTKNETNIVLGKVEARSNLSAVFV